MSPTEMIECIIIIIGGLGLFLYGIDLMGNSLKSIAGDRLKTFIEKTTNTPIKGIVVGMVATILIQSSSGTTALTVGLVRAGLLSFPQAIGIIMGANIGTTVTSFIIGLNIEKYALIFVAIGAFMLFFAKKDRVRDIASMIFGFGMLFFGLQLMGDNLDKILTAYESQVESFFSMLSTNPILGLLIGTVVTAVVQSSGATISVLQTLYAKGAIASIAALPILVGCNIGTTVTAVIAALGGGTQAKRTAFVHALFNIIGALIFMLALWPYNWLIQVIEKYCLSGLSVDGNPPAMTIAVAHFIFNFITTFILFFFIKQMVWLTEKIIKDKTPKEENILDELLDYSLIEKSSVLALSFAKKSIDYMARQVNEYVHLAKNFSFEYDEKVIDIGKEYEKKINSLDKRIHDYLIKLTITDLSDNSSKLLSKYLDLIKDLERVGDHCTNIIEFFDERHNKNLELSNDGHQDLEQIYTVLLDMTDKTTSAVATWSSEEATKGSLDEEEIDKLEDVFHQRHVHRVNNGDCSYLNSDHYVEILSNIERMGDHLYNICEDIFQDEYCQFDEFNH